jgi:hypothetical protein
VKETAAARKISQLVWDLIPPDAICFVCGAFANEM